MAGLPVGERTANKSRLLPIQCVWPTEGVKPLSCREVDAFADLTATGHPMDRHWMPLINSPFINRTPD
jgi:hypothetical protein